MNRAWEELLLKRRAHMESALAAAIECCDTAYRHVAAAQHQGDPRKIGTAHATLEKALELAHKSSIACDRIRRAGGGELTWLSQEIDEYAAAVDTAQLEQHGSETAARSRVALQKTPRTREISTVKRSVCHVRRWLAQALLYDKSLASRPAATQRTHV